MPFPLEFNIRAQNARPYAGKMAVRTSAPNGTNFKVLLSASSGG